MEKKRKRIDYNEKIRQTNSYERLMQLKNQDEKRFAMMRIMIELEDLERKFNKKKDFEFWFVEVNKRVNRLAEKYNISYKEIEKYCKTYKIKLNYGI